MRRRGLVAVAVGVLLCLPTVASAQESDAPAETGVGSSESVERDPAAQDAEPTEQASPSDETGIGEPDAVECTGAVAATVVDLDGAPVDGAVLSVAGEQVRGAGTIESLCGEVAATLLTAPDGYAPAGPTTQAVQVRRESTSAVTFTVDVVEVLGVQIEQPNEAPPAPEPTQEAAAPEPAPELAATGLEDAPVLLLAALLCGLLGTVLLGATPAPARRRATGR